MSKGPKIMADGKKSHEYTRLAVAFLGGVAITILIMSLTAGQMLQGRLNLNSIQTPKNMTARDVVQKDVVNRDIVKKDVVQKDVVNRKVLNFKDMQKVQPKEITIKMRDGETVDTTDVVTYILDNGVAHEASDVVVLEVVDKTSKDNTDAEYTYTEKNDVGVTYTVKDGSTFTEEEISYVVLEDRSKVYISEGTYVVIKEKDNPGVTYTIEIKE